jgi:hypothetical protein
MRDQPARRRKAKDPGAYIDEREKNAIAKDQMTDPFKRWLIRARKKQTGMTRSLMQKTNY